MDREHYRFVAGAELGLQWSDAHVAPYDEGGRSLDDVARDHCERSDGQRGRLAPPPAGMASATHRADRKPRISNGVGRAGVRVEHLDELTAANRGLGCRP